MNDIKRVFIGTLEIGLNVTDLARGFSQLGFDVTTGVFHANPFYRDQQYDVRLDVEQVRGIKLSHGREPFPEVVDFPPDLRWFLDFDLYVFIAGRSLLPGNADLPLLRSLGKRVVQFHTGSELRHWSVFKALWEEYGYSYPRGQDVDSPGVLMGSRDICDLNDPYHQSFINKLYNIRMSELFADVVMAQPSFNGFAIRPYDATIIPVDYSRCRPKFQHRIEPVIVHAPTNWDLKGTARILQVVEELYRKRVRFQFSIMSAVANPAVLQALSDADIVVDRLSCGGVPRFGYEAMGSGCCLVGSDERDLVPLPFDRPGVAVQPDSLAEKLREVIVDPRYRAERVERGLEFVDRGFNTALGAALNILGCLERAEHNDWDYYPDHYLRSVDLREGMAMPDFLHELTARVVDSWGVPADLELSRAVSAGVLPRRVMVDKKKPGRWALARGDRSPRTVVCGSNAGVSLSPR